MAIAYSATTVFPAEVCAETCIILPAKPNLSSLHEHWGKYIINKIAEETPQQHFEGNNDDNTNDPTKNLTTLAVPAKGCGTWMHSATEHPPLQ
jgi:hypothetical protein